MVDIDEKVIEIKEIEIEICFMIPGHTKFSVHKFFETIRNKINYF